MTNETPSLYKRIESEINSYIEETVEVSPDVMFSQYQLIKRIYKFRNKDLSGTKINADLSYNYYYDIISSRVDSEIKNLRFDTKNILAFSQNPIKDFAAVFISNASLKSWMAENGEDEKLKAVVEEFSGNGNLIFKKVRGGYETVDPLNMVTTNQLAKTIDDTALIERHEMSASDIKAMTAWDQDVADEVIKNEKNKSFHAALQTNPRSTTSTSYEIYEYTGEVSEKEFNELNGEQGGDEHTYFLAKVVIAGLKKNHNGTKHNLFIEKLIGTMSDYYIDAHRGYYNGRFWREGLYEKLFDHQVRANEIGNQMARALDWSSKIIFKSKNSSVMQNLRADVENGEVIQTDDLEQVMVRNQGVDQLIADWNRNITEADRLSNSMEVVRGENLPSGTPFRMGVLLDQNAGKMFAFLRQKITLPFQRVFREWVLPSLVKDLSAQEIFNLIGDVEMLDQLREIMVESWYVENLVKIGLHTREVAEAIKEEKLDELRRIDPTIKNVKDVWKGVLKRLFITITGENSDLADQVQDIVAMLNLEQDPDRLAWMLDMIYRARGIPIPPKRKDKPPETQLQERQAQQPEPNPQQTQPTDQPVEGQ